MSKMVGDEIERRSFSLFWKTKHGWLLVWNLNCKSSVWFMIRSHKGIQKGLGLNWFELARKDFEWVVLGVMTNLCWKPKSLLANYFRGARLSTMPPQIHSFFQLKTNDILVIVQNMGISHPTRQYPSRPHPSRPPLKLPSPKTTSHHQWHSKLREPNNCNSFQTNSKKLHIQIHGIDCRSYSSMHPKTNRLWPDSNIYLQQTTTTSNCLWNAKVNDWQARTTSFPSKRKIKEEEETKKNKEWTKRIGGKQQQQWPQRWQRQRNRQSSL